MITPTALDCELLDWMSRRKSVRWANIPWHWRRRAHQLADDDFDGPRWLERDTFVQVRITPIGRALAAAYRLGRAAAPETRTA